MLYTEGLSRLNISENSCSEKKIRGFLLDQNDKKITQMQGIEP